MFRTVDIVKTFVVCMTIGTVLGACSGGGANITPQTVAGTNVATLRTDAVAVPSACTPVSRCSYVTIIKALSAGVDKSGDLLLYGAAASTSWNATSTKSYRFAQQTIDTGSLCEDGCSLVVSVSPLAGAVATTPSVIDPKLSQDVRTMVTFPEQNITFPAGAYYFYLATVAQ